MALDLYSIGVELILNDEITTDLDGVTRQFSALQEAIDKINAGLGLTGSAVKEVTAASAGMAKAWGDAADAAERMRDAADKVHTTGPGAVVGGDEDSERNAGSHGGAAPWDALVFGGMIAGAGFKIIGGAYGQAADIQQENIRLRGMDDRLTAGDLQGADDAARQLQQDYPGVKWQDALATIGDAFMQTRGHGGMAEAIATANFLVPAAYALHEAGMNDDAAGMLNLLKTGDMRGLLSLRNPDGSLNYGPMRRFVEEATRISISEHGRVTPTDVFSVVTNAGPEGLHMDEDALATASMLVANGMSASRVGTSINALAAQFEGGKMSQAAARRLHELGLLPDWMFETDPHDDGKIKKEYWSGIGQALLPPGSLEGQDEFERNPFNWISGTLWPAIQKKFPNDQTAQLAEIYAVTSRMPGAAIVGQYVSELPLIQRQLGNLDHVPSVADLSTLAKGDPHNVTAGFVAGMDALLGEFASPAMGKTTAAITDLTHALGGLTDWGEAHPAGAVAALGGVAAGATAGGAAALWGAYKLIGNAMRGMVGGGGAGEAAGGVESVGAVEGAAGLGIVSGGVLAAIVTATLAMASEKLAQMYSRNGLDASMLSGEPVPVKIVSSPSAPVHVKPPGTPYSTPMPTAPTSHLPGQSMPMPGQTGNYR